MNASQLEHECRTYTRYLIGQDPAASVVKHYVDFHRKSEIMNRFDRFDDFLVSVSASQPLWTGLADTYASMFRRDSLVRKKLVLTLALLECVPPSYEVLDNAGNQTAVATFLFLAWRAARYGVALCASTLVFTAVQLAIALSWRPRSEAVLER